LLFDYTLVLITFYSLILNNFMILSARIFSFFLIFLSLAGHSGIQAQSVLYEEALIKLIYKKAGI